MAKGIVGLICETASLVFFCVVFALYIVFAMVRQWICIFAGLVGYLFSGNDQQNQPETIVENTTTEAEI